MGIDKTALTMEHFSRRRRTTGAALSVSYSVDIDKILLFQLSSKVDFPILLFISFYQSDPTHYIYVLSKICPSIFFVLLTKNKIYLEVSLYVDVFLFVFSCIRATHPRIIKICFMCEAPLLIQSMLTLLKITLVKRQSRQFNKPTNLYCAS